MEICYSQTRKSAQKKHTLVKIKNLVQVYGWWDKEKEWGEGESKNQKLTEDWLDQEKHSSSQAYLISVWVGKKVWFHTQTTLLYFGTFSLDQAWIEEQSQEEIRTRILQRSKNCWRKEADQGKYLAPR